MVTIENNVLLNLIYMKNKFGFIAVFSGIIFLSALFLTSCKKDNGGNNNGKIDPNTIATANLIHHWGFEDSPKDEITNKGTTVGSFTYVTGRRGKAYKGADNSYIVWDVAPTDKIATLHGYTIALWMKSPKTVGGPPMIFMITGTEFLGSLAFFQENNGNNLSDSLALKAFFTKKGALDKNGNPGWVGHDWLKSKKEFVADLWFHIALNYDPATSKAKVYFNGNYLFTALGPYNDQVRYQGDPGAIGNPNGQPLLGNLNMSLNTSNANGAIFPNKGIIGAWANRRLGTATDTWMMDYLGLLDELRVYDRALTDSEIKSLYEAEVTQLN